MLRPLDHPLNFQGQPTTIKTTAPTERLKTVLSLLALEIVNHSEMFEAIFCGRRKNPSGSLATLTLLEQLTLKSLQIPPLPSLSAGLSSQSSLEVGEAGKAGETGALGPAAKAALVSALIEKVKNSPAKKIFYEGLNQQFQSGTKRNTATIETLQNSQPLTNPFKKH